MLSIFFLSRLPARDKDRFAVRDAVRADIVLFCVDFAVRDTVVALRVGFVAARDTTFLLSDTRALTVVFVSFTRDVFDVVRAVLSDFVVRAADIVFGVSRFADVRTFSPAQT